MLPKSFFQMLFARLESGELTLAKEALTEASSTQVDESILCIVTGVRRSETIRAKWRALQVFRQIVQVDDLAVSQLVEGILDGKPFEVRLTPDEITGVQEARLCVEIKPLRPGSGHKFHLSGDVFQGPNEEQIADILARALHLSEDVTWDLLFNIDLDGIMVSNLTKADREELESVGVAVIPQGIFVGPPSRGFMGQA